jgi:hypothetical protein
MKALSIRQPWAWAILHAGKDVENRGIVAMRHMNFTGLDRIAIHAAKGMTRAEYDYARQFIESRGARCPEAADLLRGGVIGSVGVAGVNRRAARPGSSARGRSDCATPRRCPSPPARASAACLIGPTTAPAESRRRRRDGC